MCDGVLTCYVLVKPFMCPLAPRQSLHPLHIRSMKGWRPSIFVRSNALVELSRSRELEMNRELKNLNRILKTSRHKQKPGTKLDLKHATHMTAWRTNRTLTAHSIFKPSPVVVLTEGCRAAAAESANLRQPQHTILCTEALETTPSG